MVDHLLRAAGIHTCPPPRATSILYASLHGGANANIGYLEGMTGELHTWDKERAPFESGWTGGYSNPGVITYIPALLPVNRRSDGLWFEFWADTHANPYPKSVRIHTEWWTAGAAHYVTMEADFNAGKLTAWSGSNADHTQNQALQWTWDPLVVQGRFHIGWWLTWSTTGVAAIAPVVTGPDENPAFHVAGTFGTTPAPNGHLYTVALRVENTVVECFQLSQRAAKPATLAEVTQKGSWKRTAALDQPRFSLRTVPDVSGSAWDAINEIARATMATAWFDANGFFRWKNHTRWTTAPTTADLTVTSAREISSLKVTEEIDACRNHCTVRWENWSRVTSAGPQRFDDEPSPISIPPGGAITRTIAIGEEYRDPRAPRTATTATVGGPNRLAIRGGAGATTSLVHGAVEVRVSRSGGTTTVILRNRSANTVYYHGISLISLVQAESSKPTPSSWTAWNTTSQRHYGIQTLDHDVKGWVQDSLSGQILAEALRNAGSFPPPLLQSVEILPDPRIELGDVVRVVDTTGAALDTLAWVIGNRVSSDGGAIKQSLTLRGITSNGLPADAGLTPDPPTDPAASPPL
ncbi:hypothetical protein [Streptomyces uncialis]|uniref:hypothetical protein n=1 Tax=Streptomyces uncialis TaxID=1048205 RepID=UPI0037AA1C9C